MIIIVMIKQNKMLICDMLQHHVTVARVMKSVTQELKFINEERKLAYLS